VTNKNIIKYFIVFLKVHLHMHFYYWI